MSRQIRKSDYYFGAFLYSTFTNIVKTPVILYNGDNSQFVQITTETGDYTVFAKYSSKPKSKVKSAKKWDFSFTEREQDIIKNFYNENTKNIVALICSEENLTNTEVAIIDIDSVRLCLGNDSINKNRRITVGADKGAHCLYYYGTAVSDRNALKVSRNLYKHFA